MADELQDEKIIARLETGSVAHSAEEIATPIEDVISTLEEARDDGATHVVLSSGNHRGAKNMRIYADYEML